jgi:V/A-type H+-transporting ATPase subunit E
VDALIRRLKEDGVAAGRQEAERLLAEAKAQARALIEAAEKEAQERRTTARTEIEREKAAATDALRLAARDAVLEMKRTLSERFAGEIARLVSDQMRDERVLSSIIRSIALRARDDVALNGEESLEFVLPRDAIGLEELRRRPEELQEGFLTRFVRGVTGDILRAGVRFRVAEADEGRPGESGLRVRLIGRDIELDLTDQTVAELLLEHLQPRFRALLEGMVK